MTRVFNDPARFKDDMVDGFVAAYARYVERVPGASGVMVRGGPRPGRVGVVIGGGSGHYPAFCGVVGPGLATGAVIGDIFTSPSTEQAYLVGKAVDAGAGVLFSYGNYAGDVMNFGLAEQRLRAEGIDARTVLVTDDIASAPAEEPERRRGIAGDFCVFKVAGAAAERGDRLDDVERLARKTNDLTRSFGVAFAGCTFPGAAGPLFTVERGRMEIGLGIHGEPGVRSADQVPAAELAEILVEAVLSERPSGADGRAAVILNGLGSTKYEELFVIWADVERLFAGAGVTIVTPEVGELVTSLDMAGCSLTGCWLDDELAELWNAPADTPAFRRGPAAMSTEPRPRPARNAATESAAASATESASESASATGLVTASVAPAASPASKNAARGIGEGLAAMLVAIEAAESELGDLDAVAGDGDHGRGMVRGLRAAVRDATAEERGAGSTLRVAGRAWADAGGGASGVLWGAFLETIGDEVGDTEVPAARRVADLVERGADAIARLGGAQPGDKCILDALLPFVAELRRGIDNGAGFGPGWRAAAEVATSAASRTAELTPRIGRARPLADKSVGTPDPGAVSLAICLVAVGRTLP